MALSKTQAIDVAIVLISTLLIGYVDYLVDNQIRIYPLYFLPLVRAAQRFGRIGAILASLFATFVWIVAQYVSSRSISAHIWGVNFITQGTAFIVVSLLVAALRDGLQRERELSRTDLVTGVLNRRALYEVGSSALALCRRNNRPVTLAFVDLDNFKTINDTFGHDRGDALLRTVAKVLAGSLRSSDIVARVGGDEFAILLPETEATHASVLLDKARNLLLQSPDFRGTSVSVSIGAVAYTMALPSLDDMLKEADSVMYAVKGSGKNRVEVKSA